MDITTARVLLIQSIYIDDTKSHYHGDTSGNSSNNSSSDNSNEEKEERELDIIGYN